MVDLIPIRKLYKYEPLTREDSAGGRTYVYGETRLPSVTAVLSATKDQTTLKAWAERIGLAEAERIRNEAAAVGTHMHAVMERMIAYRDLPRPTNWLMVRGYELGYKLINNYFQFVSEIWGSEVPLYYPGKYAGTTDLVCVFRGKPAIVDFKQSLRPKKRQWIEDYFQQLTAYAAAHNIVHGTTIDYGVVLIACQTGEIQEFSLTGTEFQTCQALWLSRVDRFLQEKAASAPTITA